MNYFFIQNVYIRDIGNLLVYPNNNCNQITTMINCTYGLNYYYKI